MTDIYNDLVTRVNGLSKRYWKLGTITLKTLGTIEKERDELCKKLKEERMKRESNMRGYKMTIKVMQGMIEEERKLREKAERERDQAEYDSKYYAKQLMEYID